MSVTTEMYHLRPIFELDQQIPLPECMYFMKNLHGQDHNELTKNEKPHKVLDIIMEQVKRILQVPSPEVEMLESQQEEILKKLAILKEQIEKFRTQLNQPVKDSCATNKPAVTPVISSATYLNGDLNDLVVYANPDVPPYGLLALLKMWGGQISLTNHTHSTLKSPVPGSILQAFTTSGLQLSNQLRITLVWKDVGRHLQMIISPTRHTTLQGEVNMLRLLARFGPPHLDLDGLNAQEASIADWILDCVYQLVQGTAPKRELNAMLQRLQLGPSGWLLTKNHATIVDAALWSYLKSQGALECPAKLKDWQKKCNELFSK